MPKIKLEREYSVAKLPNFEKRFEIVLPNLDLGFHLVAFFISVFFLLFRQVIKAYHHLMLNPFGLLTNTTTEIWEKIY